MTNRVAFDLARLFIGPMTSTPRGIDRVDFAYARHFFEQWSGDSVGILPTPWGIRWFTRDRSLRVVNFIEDYWGETEEPDADPAYQWMKARLRGEHPSVTPTKQSSISARLIYGFSSFARQYGLAFGHPIGSLPPGTVYLNTGQITLAVPRFLAWLDRRKDVKPVFMLHDAIPIENPEYCSPRSSRSHHLMLVSTARYAARVIVTTEAAGQSIQRELARLQREDIPMIAAPLPVPLPFLKPTAPDPDLRDTTYFVVSGAIEPRKNHLLLLNVWRELARQDGGKSPKLVLVGSRWNASDAVVDLLERCEVIRGHVVEIAGLSTPGLRQLLTGARALLMPSFAEGFGIPIIEALALGTPVIASDLPAHREAGGSQVTYVSPIDGIGWLSAIRAHAHRNMVGFSARRVSALHHLWKGADYFSKIEPFVTQ
jgi:glycosyltransferase involved in cell wall biosynthesis